MNVRTNMLSAKNIKIHGMESKKWTTKDKITQYKGLINLYTRDRQVLDVDVNVASKKQYKELKKIKADIELNRHDLDNAIRGDKQQLRNTLGEHRDMQLAYQNLFPKTVIDNVHQINFVKRKDLDKLKYKMKLVSQRLIDAKLQRAFLEDRMKYSDLVGQMPVEKQAEIVTGKVQDALLKKQAALAIYQIYTQMIDVMKKDSLYFDAVLNTVKTDGLNQSTCMINATQLGQLATEYLDDRKQEYKALEHMVKVDMKTRKLDLEAVQEQVDNASTNIKQLLRRDSDINCCKLDLRDSASYVALQQDMDFIQTDLNILKSLMMVSNFEDIYPCLQQQLNSQIRLAKMVEGSVQNRDTLLEKARHAEMIANKMKNSMVETTFEYKSKKELIKTQISEQIEKKRTLDILIKRRNLLIAKTRKSFLQLKLLCGVIGASEEKKVRTRAINRFSDDEAPIEPEPPETDVKQVMNLLTNKLKLLMAKLPPRKEGHLPDDAYKLYEAFMKEQDKKIATFHDTVVVDESLLEGLELEISHVLTRDDVKRQSSQIVAANMKNDDLLPIVSAPKKKKKKTKS